MNGRFIVLEGVEGSGKSTQADLLCGWLEEEGVPFRRGREPGTTEVGEEIRGIFLSRRDGLEIPAETELLLILAARAAYTRSFVKPALEAGQVVVSDRYELSTFAYQGYGRGLDLERLRELNALATGDLAPDLTLVLDVDVVEGLRRSQLAGGGGGGVQLDVFQPLDRMEESTHAFHERVRDGYLDLSEGDDSVLVIDGGESPEEIQGRIRGVLRERFSETFRSPPG